MSALPRDVIIRYNIYRSTSKHVRCISRNEIGWVDGSTTSYIDKRVKPGKRYYYAATAVAASGRESDHPSNEVNEEIK